MWQPQLEAARPGDAGAKRHLGPPPWGSPGRSGGDRAAPGLATSRMEPGQHWHRGHSPQPCEPLTRVARKEPGG